MRVWRRRATLVLFVLAALGALGALIWLLPSDDFLPRTRKIDPIRIGYAIEPPYAFLTADGEVSGESPEVARRILERLGIRRIHWSQIEFAALIPELEAGHVDVIAAGLFITPERARRVRFSTPSFRVRPGLLVAKGNPRRLTSYREAIARPDIRLAALAGSVEADLWRSITPSAAHLDLVPDALTGCLAVESGFTDALMLSAPALRWYVRQDLRGLTEFIQTPDEPPPEANDRYGVGAFAFRLTDRQLAHAWDRAARGYLGSPEHRSLLERFGFEASEAPAFDSPGGPSP